ncbi:hypothetical protein FHW36_102236 [Chitinophaga polysaccharea]|uniref:Uncharacterized protein n=1 Tax=Chitinophaga polysaccharea TaxID=1293035 RepID=A0A561PWJ6_9BACT|nr:hypothetical protein [Chitinophaga polysaccharea]TWF42480.1 hypothetical protein FHW36_102236 [Chitinophaga polysaccharea]
MTFENLKLYEIFRLDLHLPDNRAMEAMVAMDDFFSLKITEATKDMATKTELQSTKNELKTEIEAVKHEVQAVKHEVQIINTKLEHMNHNMNTNMATKRELAEVEARVTKSIYMVGLGQLLVVIISVLTILKYAGVIK